MKWNLRLTAANRGIWKASELQRMLAERFPQEARVKEYLAITEKFAPQMLS